MQKRVARKTEARRLGRTARAAFGESGRAGAEKGEATTRGCRSFGQTSLFLARQSPQGQRHVSGGQLPVQEQRQRPVRDDGAAPVPPVPPLASRSCDGDRGCRYRDDRHDDRRD